LSREQELSVKKIIRDDARIVFPEILACILEQQMQVHEQYLHKFTQLFKICDVDGNGVLCEEEFRHLMKMLNESSVVLFADH
jgi:Ca2+-binding EF-hand superfamily protein